MPVFFQMLTAARRWGWYVGLSPPLLLQTSPVTLSSLPGDYCPSQFLVLSRKFWGWGISILNVQSSKVCKWFEEWEAVALPTTLHCLLCHFLERLLFQLPSVWVRSDLKGSSIRNSLFLKMPHSQMWTRKELFQPWERDLLYKENVLPLKATFP